MRISAEAEGARVVVAIHGDTSFHGGADKEGMRTFAYEEPAEALRDALNLLTVARDVVHAQQVEERARIRWLEHEVEVLSNSFKSLNRAVDSARIERDQLRARVGE